MSEGESGHYELDLVGSEQGFGSWFGPKPRGRLHEQRQLRQSYIQGLS